LGVEGEAKAIVEDGQAGIPITPEAPRELLDAVLQLKNDPDAHARMGQNAHNYVHQNFDRQNLARDYTALLRQVVGADTQAPIPA
jgi:glycosyltransferase involved in cell wall biosynthesis